MFKKQTSLLGQVVKTSPSHGGIRGSTPLGDTKRKRSTSVLLFRWQATTGSRNTENAIQPKVGAFGHKTLHCFVPKQGEIWAERARPPAKRSCGAVSRPWSEPTEGGGEGRRICPWQRRELPWEILEAALSYFYS